MHNRWEITRFVKEHICLVQIEQNKHKNLSSKFISMSISHLVANYPEIPISNIIQEREWYTCKFAIERAFGSWDTTFTILPKYLQACFSPCIDGFPYCRPVISVDGTHLRGPYKGNPPRVGIGSLKTCENTLLKIATLMWQAGTETKQWKFDCVMKGIQERNVDAYIYLIKLDPEKWTLLHDGGHKHDIMITNIFEALNSVLKKARVLPLKALVELIFNKLVKYFHQHREEAENCVHSFPTRIFDKFLRIEMKSREHKVTTYNPREGIYMVKSPIRISGTGNNFYTLRLNNKCSCGKW
ncbi:hypothetical protein M9H77_33725 [Catharanthus roseus]|uniref:Uncharacterized protein n=1 Tax=Catharanthus roseus TaxID=4058 RepID=A0ACB9ZJH2_CATRO|nr:hypothetical protein M9H77_33725 [Catharanthus roseus]